MRIVKFTITTLFLFFTVVSGLCLAQNESRTALDFLSINNSIRSISLGEATVSISGYPSASHINPASIGVDGFIQGTSNISWQSNDPLRFYRPTQGFNVWSSDVGGSFRDKKYAASVSLKMFDLYNSSDFTSSDFKGRSLNTSFAYQIADHTWAGIGLNYIYSRIENIFTPEDDKVTAKNISFDLGIIHKRVYETDNLLISPSVGWSLTEFGPTFSYSPAQTIGGQEIKYGLPMTMRLGLTVKLSMKKVWQDRPYAALTLLGSLSKLLGRTNTEGDPHGPFKSLFSSWGDYQRRSDGETIRLSDQILRHQGIELSIFDILYGRIGYINRPIKNYGYDISSIGFGIDLFYLNLDYSHIANKRDEDNPFFKDNINVWQITVRIPINDTSNHNFWPKLIESLK